MADTTKAKLKDVGIICGGGVYEVPCHKQPVFSEIYFDPKELSETEALCPQQICPPITSGTTLEDARYIADQIVKIVG